LLTAVSFLTTRVSKPTHEDWGKLERVLMYLNGCQSLGIVLKASDGLRVLAYVDASFATPWSAQVANEKKRLTRF
jgi:hypothetical protein